MKIISILTEKGGVGKTTTSIHLGACFAEIGKKTLIIDFDPQMNLTEGYKVSNDIIYNVKNLLENDIKNFSLFEKNKNLYILKGNRFLEDVNLKASNFSNILKLIGEKVKFHYAIIDCPPRPITSNSLGELALSVSDFIISPIEAEQYSINGINSLIPSLLKIKRELNPKLTFLGFFFNKSRENTTFFKKYRKIAKESVPNYVFNTYVRNDIIIEYAKEQGKTVFEEKPSARIAEDYQQLVKEIMKKIKENE